MPISPILLVRSGNILSGQIIWAHVASGTLRSGNMDPNFIAGLGNPGLTSGLVRSGHLDTASVNTINIASGAVRSGSVGIVGTPDGTKFFRDDYTWGTVGSVAIGSGDIQSGKVASGVVQGYFGTTRHITSGSVGVFDLGSGAVIAGTIGSGAVASGNVASGSIGSYHLARDSVLSGDVGSGQIGTVHYALASVLSGIIGSGQIGTLHILGGGLLSGAFGSGQIGNVNLASGAVQSGHIANTAVNSGNVASGQIGWSHLSSGSIRSGHIAATGTPDGTKFLRDDYTWATAGSIAVGSGDIQSGKIASGAVQGQFGATRHVASGTLGPMDHGSGAIAAGNIGSGAVVSGNLASGQIGAHHLASGTVLSGHIFNAAVSSGNVASGAIGDVHIASGAIRSGHIAATGTPDGTKFLRDDYTWATAGSIAIGSGDIQSGKVASGVIAGYFGATRHITSGSVGVFDLGSGAVIAGAMGSGAVIAGNVGSGAIVSGAIASGQISTNHLSSGIIANHATRLLPSFSGVQQPLITEELISGVRAVAISQSGRVRVAMAGLSGRNFAHGVVIDTILSGMPAPVYTMGLLQIASGMVDFANYLGDTIYLGRSGQLVPSSGSWNSGGLLSGDVTQPLGTAINSGAILLGIAATLPSVVTQIASGDIASGQIGFPHLANASVQSGTVASGQVGFSHLANASVQSGTIASGQIIWAHIASGTIRSGNMDPNFITSFTATLTSGAVQSGHVASGAVQGQFGATRHVASGTIGPNDLGSGAILSGAIASGQIGTNHVAAASLTSGLYASGQISWMHIASGVIRSGNMDPNFITNLGSALTSGAVQSGHVASGAVQGQLGATRHVASGTIGPMDLGSGAILSGAVASGQIGAFHLASGAVLSGAVASGQIGAFHLASGSITSGHLASGTVQGQYGATRHLASGTIGPTDCVSGLNVSRAFQLMTTNSGQTQLVNTEEAISGIRAINISQSGYARIAMASVSGRMPAVGFTDNANYASGAKINIIAAGFSQCLDLASGVVDFSGYVGMPLYVGRSGQISTTSGHLNSGGLLSGDVWQPIGTVMNSGGAIFGFLPQMAFVPGLITSGNIASGQVGKMHLTSGFITARSGIMIEYDGANIIIGRNN